MAIVGDGVRSRNQEVMKSLEILQTALSSEALPAEKKKDASEVATQLSDEAKRSEFQRLIGNWAGRGSMRR